MYLIKKMAGGAQSYFRLMENFNSSATLILMVLTWCRFCMDIRQSKMVKGWMELWNKITHFYYFLVIESLLISLNLGFLNYRKE